MTGGVPGTAQRGVISLIHLAESQKSSAQELRLRETLLVGARSCLNSGHRSLITRSSLVYEHTSHLLEYIPRALSWLGALYRDDHPELRGAITPTEHLKFG